MKPRSIPADYTTYSNKFLKMLEPYERLWGEHVERIYTAEHRVVLMSPNMNSIRSASYCNGPRVRDIERSDTHNLLNLKPVEAIQTKRALTVIFEQK